jgi:hypothetical protein
LERLGGDFDLLLDCVGRTLLSVAFDFDFDFDLDLGLDLGFDFDFDREGRDFSRADRFPQSGVIPNRAPSPVRNLLVQRPEPIRPCRLGIKVTKLHSCLCAVD